MKVYLAGGAVRDLLLGRPVTDRDYLVMNATREEFLEAHPNAQQVGRTFPIFLLDRQEFSFPRADSLMEEIMARDLTVNAMLLDEAGELFCHPRALEDLRQQILRPASPRSFIDDPLRVFRAARFWAKFPEFQPSDDLIKSMKEIAGKGLLNALPADRVGQEVIKALKSPAPGNFFRLLAQTNTLTPWFEELRSGLDIPAGPIPYHDTNVIEHTCRTMDALAGDEIAVWMAFCHDLGKLTTQEDQLPKHHGHDKRGVKMAEDISKRIRLSNAHAAAGSKAAQWHMVAGRYKELRPGTKVDLLMSLHLSRTLEPFFKLVRADQDMDYMTRAKRDLSTILSVSLPNEFMNRGEESGIRLHGLRAQALTRKYKK